MAEIKFNIQEGTWEKLLDLLRRLTGATKEQAEATDELNEEFETLGDEAEDVTAEISDTSDVMTALEKALRENIEATRGLTEDLGTGALNAIDNVETSTQALIKATKDSSEEFEGMQAAANVLGDIQHSSEALEEEFARLNKRLAEMKTRTDLTDAEIEDFAQDADALANDTRDLQREIKAANAAMKTMADVADNQTIVALEEFGTQTDRLNKRLGALAKETKIAAKGARDLGENTNFLGKIGAEVERRIGSFGGEIGALAGAGGPITLAIGAVAALGVGLFKITESARETVKEIAKLSRQTGLSTGTISQLRALALLTGTNIETLADAFGDLSEKAMKAATGQSKEFADAFNLLNIELRTASGALRPINEIFIDVQRGLSLIADTTARAALAQTLFGGKADNLGQILGRTATEFAALNKEADAFAVDVSPKTIAAFESLDREAAKLSLSIKQAFLPIGEFVVRSLNAFIATVKTGAAAGLNFRTALVFVNELTKQFKETQEVATNTGQKYSVMLGEITTSATKYTDAQVKAITETERLDALWKSAATSGEGIFQIRDATEKLPTTLEEITVKTGELAAIEFHGVERLLAGLIQAELFTVNLTQKFLSLAQVLQQGIADGIFDAVTGARSLDGALEQVGRTLRDEILRTLTEIASKEILRGLFSLIPGGGIFSNIGGQLLGFQHGGIVTEPTLAMLGERGPERVIPLAHPNENATQGAGATNNLNLSFQVSGVMDGQGFEDTVQRRIIPLINRAVMKGITVQATRGAR